MTSVPGGDLTDGIRLLQAGDFSSALAFFHRAVGANPQDGQAFGYLGITQARLGDLQNAVLALYEAARLQPTDAGAHYNLAIGLMQVQRTPEARTVLERTLALNPEHANARAALESLGPATAGPMGGYGSPSVTPTAPPQRQPLDPDLQPEWSAANPAPPMQNTLPAPIYPPPSGSSYPGMAPGGPYNAPTAQGGMQYNPVRPQRPSMIAPPVGTRLIRGLGWGALYGQWWTLWNVFWSLVRGGSSGHTSFGVVALVILVVAVVFAVIGMVMGLIMGAVNANVSIGAAIGVVVGLLLCGLELLLSHSAVMVINVFFWFFTGRYIGSNVAARIQRPVSA